jgi:hypothetical protein
VRAQRARVIDHAAAVALRVSTVLGVLELGRAYPVLLEPLLRDEHVDVIPGEPLVERSLAELVVRVEARLLDRLEPDREIAVLVPRAKRAPSRNALETSPARRSARETIPSRKVSSA